ncbi:unnamed protein product [Lupinus luteus]|uniref:Protein kinase domain-containing protein n=1 Tax=Lupinus luteus TaxID=3873 RepID=A0AAV1WVR6_LUPLU
MGSKDHQQRVSLVQSPIAPNSISMLKEPQKNSLSDFGLAIWGRTASSFLTQEDVVRTFGYLAPEYFLYGKVSDKIDVYAFGVVLLEILSRRKPISSEPCEGEEILVLWAKPIIEAEDIKGLLDLNL